MSRYIARRILIAIPLLLVVVALVFFITRLFLPGDPAVLLAGERATPELIETIRRNLGLDKSVLQQFIIFLGNAVQGDLGRSVKLQQPVMQVIAKAFPFTLTLTILSVTFGTIVGLVIGIITALKRNTWIDTSSMAAIIFFYSMPTFWLGLMLMLVLGVTLRLLPVQGTGSWKNFVMPVLTLGTGEAAVIARLTRSSMLEVLGADYVRTARAKGLTERIVLLRHALKNALIPVVTIVGLSIGGLLGGAVITETIFGLPGVGSLSIQAITSRDYPMIQATVLLVAVAFIFVNLLVDVIYAFVDPRIHYE
jgi:ABC-type dipeptide/oligopeptide/nickel transport system permease component